MKIFNFKKKEEKKEEKKNFEDIFKEIDSLNENLLKENQKKLNLYNQF